MIHDTPRILVVEGTPPEANARVVAEGCKPYGPAYADVMRALDPALECTVVRPCVDGPECLPAGMALGDFDGVVWSGSALNVYDPCPEIENQLRLADAILSHGLPVFGSCWGHQLVSTALGGKVHMNPRGRELGAVADITLTEAGAAHPMTAGRPKTYTVLEAHRDEVAELPPGAVLLAGNATSPVQAIAVETGGVDFWGAQYHPEIDYATIAAIMQRTHEALLREGFFPSDAAYQEELALVSQLDNPETTPPPGKYAAPEIRTVQARGLELLNWLRVKVRKSV